MPAEYQLELIHLQESDELHATYGESSLLFNCDWKVGKVREVS